MRGCAARIHIALRFLAFSAIAAAPLNGQVSVRAVGGLVSSNWSFSSGCQDCQEPLPGFAAGLSFTVPTGRAFAFTPELLYASKGSSVLFGGNVWIDFRLHYVEVPLLLQFMPRTTGSIRPFIVAGPEFAITAACSTKATNSPANGGTVSFDPCTTGEANIGEDQPDPLDFGFIVGAGAALRRFSASVRYDQGLTDIYGRYAGSGTIRNTTWLVLVAVRL